MRDDEARVQTCTITLALHSIRIIWYDLYVYTKYRRRQHTSNVIITTNTGRIVATQTEHINTNSASLIEIWFIYKHLSYKIGVSNINHYSVIGAFGLWRCARACEYQNVPHTARIRFCWEEKPIAFELVWFGFIKCASENSFWKVTWIQNLYMHFLLHICTKQTHKWAIFSSIYLFMFTSSAPLLLPLAHIINVQSIAVNCSRWNKQNEQHNNNKM